MAKISVIIPIYNSEKFINKCIDSILNQTLKDIEIICINDGIIDSSWDIIQNYANNDTRFVLIDNKINKKQGYCRNLGLKQASSPYIHFLDSDDWIVDNTFYEAVYDKLISKKLDLYVFNYYEYDEQICKLINNEKEKKYPFICDKNIFNQFIFSGMSWDKVYSKDFLLQHKIFFAEDVYWEDILFNFLLKINAPKMEFTNEKFLAYRLNANSSTTTNIIKIYKDSIKMAKISKAILEKNGIWETYKFAFVLNYLSILCFDILNRVKDKSLVFYFLMQNELKIFFKSLELSEELLKELEKQDKALYKCYIKLENYSILNGLIFYFIQWLFSIKNFDETKKIITFLGIKFSIRRRNA